MPDLDKRLDEIEKKIDFITNNPYSMLGSQIPHSDNEIDLRQLWDVICAGKWIIFATTFLFAVASVAYALSLPNIYKSEVLLAPAEENSGGLASNMGQLGGLASLAGVTLGEAGADKTTLALNVLKSREFIFQFIKQRELLVPLMAAKDWDRGQNKLIIDPDIYDESSGSWVRSPKPPHGSEPSMQEAYKAFSKKLIVSQDSKSSFVSLSYEHYSPYVAKEWVDWLIEDINETIKSRDVAEAKKSIEYLSSQLTKTPIADMQSIFYEFIEEQTKTIMFAEVRDEYVFKTIDKAIVPELKFKPKKSLIFLLGVILGGILSVLYILVCHFVRGE